LEILLLISERYRWFGFNDRKGSAVLLCVAIVGGSLLLMATGFALGLVLGRRVQFSVKTLLLLMAVTAFACGWMAEALAGAKRQRETVRAARTLGCGIYYDYNLRESGGVQFFSGGRPGATRLAAWLSEDFFHEIVGANVSSDEALLLLEDAASLRRLDAGDSQVTNAGMKALESFPRLEWLDLRDAAQVGDDGLKHIQGLSRLRSLQLRRTAVTDAGMIYLKDLRELEVLDLGMTRVTGEGLPHLAGLTHLRQLFFWGNNIDDASLSHLRGMSQLQELDLGGAQATDAGLENLANLRQLQALGLRGSQVTDAGLRRLQTLTRLNRLDLFNTRITDAGLTTLASWPQLETLHLGETPTSVAGVKRLQQALPACKIER
jgi:hypothetical protein